MTSAVEWAGAAFIVWASWRGWKLWEAGRRERESRRKGVFYGEAVFHVAVIVMLYALLWSLGRR